ncbi:MAG: HIT family protein [Acidimicrobiia bacterium]|nr:HIT family protein [Acidimicrobiia bacterium]NNC74275.1 HIT family protein [Acidimicrobiia bacterium]
MTTRAADCVFCDIIAERAPATIVAQDDRVLVVMDIRPVTAGHMLVIPREHVRDLAEIDPDTAARMFHTAQRLTRSLSGCGLPHEGTNLFYADGEAAFQEVFHAHLHVIPRFPGDGFRISATGWTDQPSRDQLEANAELIRAALEGDN